jgi:urease gamma subunit
MEQALESRIDEGLVDTMMKDPKTKAIMQKAQKGTTLNPDEQKVVTAIAMAPKEAKKKKYKGNKVMESEVQQAQVVLAAQDMVDRVQGMIEDITEMEYKDLPALVESIRNEVGTSEAQSYREQATTSLEGLVEALQNAKVQLESAQGVLTGQEPIVPGEGEMDVDVEVDGDAADVDVDVEEPAEEPRSDLEASLGRARR